jgi:hypothetical protein
VAPTVFLSEPLVTPPPKQREQGIAAISAPDIRWLRCDLKAISLLANCLLRQQAVDAGCVETILFRDGYMTEGAASNIFVVKDGVLLAPPKNNLMLPGITYDVVLELAAAHGVPHEVRRSPRPKRAAPTKSVDDLLDQGSAAHRPARRPARRRRRRPGPVFAGCTPGTRTSSDGDARR